MASFVSKGFRIPLGIAALCVCCFAVSALYCLGLQARPATSHSTGSTDDQDPKTVGEARTALGRAEAAHPGNTPEVAEALINLVFLQITADAVSQDALANADRAIRVAESATGKNSSLYGRALGAKARVLQLQDHAEQARSLAEEALAIEQRAGDDLRTLAETAGTLATICDTNGDPQCALQASELQLSTYRKMHTDNQVWIATALSNIMHAHRGLHDSAAAQADADQLQVVVDRAEDNNNVWAIMEQRLGAFYIGAGDCNKSLVHLKKASAIITKISGPDSISLSAITRNLADTETCVGATEAALRDYGRARELYIRRYGPTHSRTAGVAVNYGYALNYLGRYKEAIDQEVAAHALQREHIRLAIQLMPEHEALDMAGTALPSYYTLVSIATRHPNVAPAEAYQEIVRSRGLVAEEMARRQAALHRFHDPSVRKLEQEVENQRRTVYGLQNQPGSPKIQAALDEANRKMVAAERELARRSAPFRAQERAQDSNVADLRRNLPAHSVLISYVLYAKYADTPGSFNKVPVYSLAAFVLHPETERIGVYDLGDYLPAKKQVHRMLESANSEAHSGGIGSSRNEKEYREAGEELRKQIWDPLASELKGIKLAMVVPDGDLSQIPFSSLPVADGYLVEHGPVIHVLSSERDLLPDAAAGKKAGLLAVGGPSFELAKVDSAPANLRGMPASCEAFRATAFYPLPQSLDEVRDISSTWKRWNTQEPEQLLTGENATRSRFLEAAQHARVLHIATHAFVFDSSCGDRNPLLRSGLAFAGANIDRETGILTAQQIASLDLNGVDWAVLSACNTGGGKFEIGEGILGLQRAFRVAGVHSVIMTLWPVDDAATRDYMRTLYAERFGRHTSTAQAVWLSDRKMLHSRRTAGESTHPWYWAGFVGAGGWQ